MSKIKHAYLNLFENGTVTLSAGTAAPGFPLYRIHDRNIGRLFKATAAETVTVKLDATAIIDAAQNLAVNSGFETGAYDPGWTPHGFNSIDSAIKRSGAFSSKVVTNILGAFYYTLKGGIYEIDISLPLYAALYYHITAITGEYSVELVEYDSLGAELAATQIFAATATTGGFTLGTISFGPSGSGADVIFNAATAKVGFREANTVGGAATVAYLDDTYIKQPQNLVDRLIIPPGHNLDGVTVTVEYSADDIVYHTAASQVVLPGLVDLPFAAPITALFWKVSFISPAAPVEIPELFLTSTYEHPRNPARPSGPHDLVHTVEAVQLAGGSVRYVALGPSRRRRVYRFEGVSAAHLAELQALDAAWAGSNPFWLCDHEGQWMYVELKAPLGTMDKAQASSGLDLNCLEVLP